MRNPFISFSNSQNFPLGIGAYRYTFNGKEKVDELHGNVGDVLDFNVRIYDARLGCFLSVDPKSRQYTSWSPYQFAHDNPIRHPDNGYGPPPSTRWNTPANFGAAQPTNQTGAVGANGQTSSTTTAASVPKTGAVGPNGQTSSTTTAPSSSTTGATGPAASSTTSSSSGVVGTGAAGSYFGVNGPYETFASAGQGSNSTVLGIKGTDGQWMVRVDEAHGNMGPHINVNVKPDPHIPISNSVLKVAEGTSTVLKVVNKVAIPVAIAADVYRIDNAYQADGNQVGQNTVTATAGVAGGWTGAWAGAEAGGILGAEVGTAFCPVVGTAIGGLVGGIVGGIGGSFVGDYVGTQAASSLYQTSSTGCPTMIGATGPSSGGN